MRGKERESKNEMENKGSPVVSPLNTEVLDIRRFPTNMVPNDGRNGHQSGEFLEIQEDYKS